MEYERGYAQHEQYKQNEQSPPNGFVGTIALAASIPALTIGFGVAVMAVREWLKQKFITEVFINHNNIGLVLINLANLPVKVAPCVALNSIKLQLSTLQTVATVVTAVALIGGVASLVGVFLSKNEKVCAVTAGISLSLVGLSIGAGSLLRQLPKFLRETYNDIIGIPDVDAFSKGIYLERFSNDSNAIMKTAIVIGSILVAVGIVATIIAAINAEGIKEIISKD